MGGTQYTLGEIESDGSVLNKEFVHNAKGPDITDYKLEDVSLHI
jgi:hypothetical protein